MCRNLMKTLANGAGLRLILVFFLIPTDVAGARVLSTVSKGKQVYGVD